MKTPGQTALSERVAIVTGGATGIGRATAMRLSAAGALVVVADLDRAGAEACASELVSNQGVALGLQTDVSEESSVHDLVAATVAEFGRVDILFSNAAATDLIPQDRDLLDLDTALWDMAMAVNVRGTMLGAKHVVPFMKAQGSGVIINTASSAALLGDMVKMAYGTSKAAIVAMTKYIATMYGRFGIRCNAVCPGLIITEAMATRSPTAGAAYARHRLVTRDGSMQDIAALVCFLASDDAGYITGETIVIDGGMTAHRPDYIDYIERQLGAENQPV
jgi:NAD(P)-dependent dehydrogenase (short-subunit alcohol dehydrogenase family)